MRIFLTIPPGTTEVNSYLSYILEIIITQFRQQFIKPVLEEIIADLLVVGVHHVILKTLKIVPSADISVT